VVGAVLPAVAGGPVIIAGSAQAGVVVLREALTSAQTVTWIDAPGIVHLGHQVARVWSRVDGRRAAPQALAQAAVRSLLQSMLAGRLATDGRRTWAAATVPAPREGLDFFARIFPAARFVCLHRRCDGVIRAVLAANRWGLGGDGTGFDGYVMKHPWSPAAAVAEYWAAQTEALAGFEADHPEACLRVRYEDMTASPESAVSALADFTGMHLDATLSGADALAKSAPVPGRIPAWLMDRVNKLMTDLGYPELEPPERA
jgi:hypothetical protein